MNNLLGYSCNHSNPTFFNDWCRGFGGIKLCLDCTKKHLPDTFDKSVLCGNCNERFLKRVGWETDCFRCWKLKNRWSNGKNR